MPEYSEYADHQICHAWTRDACEDFFETVVKL